MLNRLICKIMGHRRGRWIPYSAPMPPMPYYKMYECPRCGATWARKTNKRKEAK